MDNHHADHAVRTCRFGVPTLFLQYPYWIDSLDWPWSCTVGRNPIALRIEDMCTDCPKWKDRMAEPGDTSRT